MFRMSYYTLYIFTFTVETSRANRGVATSMIAWHKKRRHDLIVVLHLKSCGVAEKSLRGCLRRAIIEVATSR